MLIQSLQIVPPQQATRLSLVQPHRCECTTPGPDVHFPSIDGGGNHVDVGLVCTLRNLVGSIVLHPARGRHLLQCIVERFRWFKFSINWCGLSQCFTLSYDDEIALFHFVVWRTLNDRVFLTSWRNRRNGSWMAYEQ